MFAQVEGRTRHRRCWGARATHCCVVVWLTMNPLIVTQDRGGRQDSETPSTAVVAAGADGDDDVLLVLAFAALERPGARRRSASASSRRRSAGRWPEAVRRPRCGPMRRTGPISPPGAGTVGLGPLPAEPATVAGYVAELAFPDDDRPPAAVATITRRLAAIGQVHGLAGYDNPAADPLVRQAMRGVRRALGVAPHQKRAVTTEEIAAAVAQLGDRLIDHRDRALLLLGFAGGMRRSA